MPKVTIYHNPKCSKSRETLALLHKHHIEPKIIEYLATPPTVSQLTSLLTQLQLKPRELLRRKEPIYKTLGLNNEKISDAKIIAAMAKHPILIERPIVVCGKKAVLGRPPENVLGIL